MKIVIDEAIPYLRERLSSVAEIVSLPGVEIDAEPVRDADALIVRTRTRCDSSLLEGSAVKLVATATAGTDHIDRQWCDSAGITTANAAGSNAPAVAQYVISALIHAGFDPLFHTLGIVGKGNVGSIVDALWRKAGGKTIVSDPPKGIDVALEEVLAGSDAVTFHVPLTFEGDYPTYKMLNASNISLLRKGALVINASRGGVVEEKALLRGIENRGVQAVIDTWEGEPDPNPDLLEKALFATPHIAGYSLEGKQRATDATLRAVESFFNLQLDHQGLAGPYALPERVDLQEIADSYDIAADTAALRANPQAFEDLRNHYRLRSEPPIQNSKFKNPN